MEAGSIVEHSDGEALRNQLHGMWAAVSGGWAEHAEYADTRGAAITEQLLDLAAPAPGDRGPELPCAPGGPGPFSLSDADRLAGLLAAAGLTDVAVTELAVPLRASSFDEWWERTSALAGPLAKILASLPEPAAEALRVRARDASRAYETPNGLEFPGVSLIASAARA